MKNLKERKDKDLKKNELNIIKIQKNEDRIINEKNKEFSNEPHPPRKKRKNIEIKYF